MTAFVILAGVALVAAAMVVATRNPVLSSLWLALNFAAVAGVFVLCNAQFLAAVQLIVYAGAILVFFLFVIMLLNLAELPAADPRVVQRWLGLYLALVVAVLVAFAIHANGERFGPEGTVSPEQVAEVGNTAALGVVLYRDYVLPFELVGVLLTAAVVGAVVLTRKRVADKP